jgi:hypothetical protein
MRLASRCRLSQLLMDALSLVGQGFRGRLYDHGGRYDILASSWEDERLPLALLDLIVHTTCPRPRALSVEVLRARASVVAMFIGLISFMGPSSFQALLVILGLFSRGAWN